MLRVAAAGLAFLMQGGVVGYPGIGHGPMLKGARPSAGGHLPFFDFDPAPQPAEDALTASLTVNGTTMAPTFRAYADGSGGYTVTHGNVLNFGLIGTSANEPTPTDGDSVTYSAASYHQVDSTDTGDIGTEDFVVEVYYKTMTSPKSSVVATSTTSGPGWSVVNTTLDSRLDINDGANSKQTSITSDPDAWIHSMFFVDRSGLAYSIANGRIGAGVDVSTVGSISSTDKLTVGGNSSGGQLHPSNIAYISVWKASSWLDNSSTVDILSVARRRFYGLAGVGGGDPSSVVYTRAAPAVMRRGTRLYTVVSGWPRVGMNAAGNDAYIAERSRSNKLLYSNDLTVSATWLQGAGSPYYVTTGGSTTDPWGDISTTIGLVSDSAGGSVSHVIEQIISTASVVSTFSAYVRAGDQYGVLLYDSTTADGVYFNATTGAAGTILGTVIDTYTETIGGGWFRVGFSWTPTAAIQYMRVYLTPADGVTSFIGTDAAGAYVTGVQIEQNDQPSSPILTTASIYTRDYDSLYHTVPAIFSGGLTVDSVAQVMYAATTDAALAACVVQVTNSGQTEYLYNRALASPTYIDKMQFLGVSGGATQWNNIPTQPYLTGADINDRVTVSTNDIKGYRSTTLTATDTAAIVPTGMDLIYIGTQKSSGATNSFMGYVSRVRIWGKVMRP